jgi:ankyrin repeat protein
VGTFLLQNGSSPKLLLAKSADVRAKDNDGKMTLAMAVQEEKTGMVKLLKKYGAR